MSAKEKFPHPYKECFVPLSNWCGISQSAFLGGPTSLLAHRPVSSSNTICNNPSPSLANIVRFSLLCIAVSHTVWNTFTRERFPDPYKECFVPLSKRCGISQSTPFGGPASSLTHHSMSSSDTICNSPSPPLADIVLFSPLRRQPHSFKTRLLGRGFPPL